MLLEVGSDQMSSESKRLDVTPLVPCSNLSPHAVTRIPLLHFCRCSLTPCFGFTWTNSGKCHVLPASPTRPRAASTAEQAGFPFVGLVISDDNPMLPRRCLSLNALRSELSTACGLAAWNICLAALLPMYLGDPKLGHSCVSLPYWWLQEVKVVSQYFAFRV